MPQYIKSPNANGTSYGWNNEGQDADWKCVDEYPTHNNDTDYIENFVSDTLETFHFQNPSLEGTINWVRVYIVSKYTVAASHVHCVVRTGGSNFHGAEEALTTSYALDYHQWSTNPNTSAAWTWADISALEIGVDSTQGKDGSVRVTQIYVVVDYTEEVAKEHSFGYILGA